MFGFITLFLVLSLMLSGTAGAGTATRASWYGAVGDGESEIELGPDNMFISGAFSFCAWVKGKGRLLNYLYPKQPGIYLWMPGKNQVNMQFYGTHMTAARDRKDIYGKKTPTDAWFQYCGTYDKTFYRAYINGVQQGYKQGPAAPGRTLPYGTLTIGPIHGDLFDLNFYSKELTEEEIFAMSAGENDPCLNFGSGYLDEFKTLKWEDILKNYVYDDKKEYVYDVDVGCLASDDDSNDDSEDDSDQDDSDDDSEDDSEMNKINAALEEAKKELEEAKKELEEAKKELLEAKKELENVEECDELPKGELSICDVFYSPNFYNKKFTRKLQKKFLNTWRKNLKKLLGKTLTDEAIKKFKD